MKLFFLTKERILWSSSFIVFHGLPGLLVLQSWTVYSIHHMRCFTKRRVQCRTFDDYLPPEALCSVSLETCCFLRREVYPARYKSTITKVITGRQKAGWGPGGWREVRGEEGCLMWKEILELFYSFFLCPSAGRKQRGVIFFRTHKVWDFHDL